MGGDLVRASEVKEALRVRHGANNGMGQWVCIEEAFSGFKSPGGGVDLLAIGAWQTAGASGLPGAGSAVHHAVVAYEVKVTRADLRRELNGYTPGPNTKWSTRAVPPWPGKAHFALRVSHYFMFAVPVGLLKPEELTTRERPTEDKGLWIPPEVGLIEVGDHGCQVRQPAQQREAKPFTVPQVAELIRHAVDPNRTRRLRIENSHLRSEVKHLRGRLDELQPSEPMRW